MDTPRVQPQWSKQKPYTGYLWKGKRIGRYRPLCRGRIVCSPDFPCSIFTALIVIGPSLVHIAFR